jgi:hypothetical protein
MHLYQIQIVTIEDKVDEFAKTLRTHWLEFQGGKL